MYLKEWRWDKGYTQKDLGELLGFSQTSIAFIETGRQDSRFFAKRFKDKFSEDFKLIEEFKKYKV